MKHAILGASSSHRWINCPGSVRRIALLPKAIRNSSSIYADEGNAGHDLCEMCLKDGTGEAWMYEGQMIEGQLQKWEVTEEMIDAAQIYVDYVMTLMNEKQAFEVGVEISGQPFLDRDDMFGTADCAIDPWNSNILDVIDFKYGAGVVVDVEWNDQMMYYGLGALNALRDGEFEATEFVRLTIVQPRAYHEDGPIRPWIISKDDLLEWGDELRAAADRTEDPDAELKEGEWCQFCPLNFIGAGGCEVKAAERKTLLKSDWAGVINEYTPAEVVVIDPNTLSPEGLAEALHMLPMLESAIKQTRAVAMEYAKLPDKDIPGFKIVRGRDGNRRWVNGAEVERKLKRKAGAKNIYKKTLKSPAQIEKIVPKEWVEANVERPEGKLHLVPADDAREAVQIAAEVAKDFREVIAEEASKN